MQLRTRCLHNSTNFSCCMSFCAHNKYWSILAFTLLTAQSRHVQIDFAFECAFNDFLFFLDGKVDESNLPCSWLSSRSAILERSSFFFCIVIPERASAVDIKHRIQIIFAIIDELLSETFPGKLNQMKRWKHQSVNINLMILNVADALIAEGDDFIAFY